MQLKLSQTKIRKLTPGAKRMDYFDTVESGLILRVETSGKKTWIVSQRVPKTNKRIYYTLGSWGEKEITTEQARNDAQTIKQIIRKTGAAPLPPAAATKPKSPTLGELYEKYQNQLKNHYKTEASRKTALKNIERFKADFWSKPADEIKPLDIAAWQKREGEKYTASYLNKNLSALQVMLDWAADPLTQNINLEKNPIKGIKRLKEDDSKDYAMNLTETAYKEFVKKLRERDEKKRDYWLPAILLATNSGLRKGTLFGIKWENIDWSARRITLNPEIMKVKRKKQPEQDTAKFICINYEALKALKAWKEHCETDPKKKAPTPEDLVFGVKQPRYQTWKKIRKEVGLPEGTRIHDLRHIFASRMLPEGVTSIEGAELLHQSTTGLFRRYAHLSPDAALKLVNLIGEKEEDDDDYDGEEL
jgi:integrase